MEFVYMKGKDWPFICLMVSMTNHTGTILRTAVMMIITFICALECEVKTWKNYYID